MQFTVHFSDAAPQGADCSHRLWGGEFHEGAVAVVAAAGEQVTAFGQEGITPLEQLGRAIIGPMELAPQPGDGLALAAGDEGPQAAQGLGIAGEFAPFAAGDAGAAAAIAGGAAALPGPGAVHPRSCN